MSTPFLRIRPWNFAHVLNVPLPGLSRMFFILAENVGSLKTHISLQNPQMFAKNTHKNAHSFNARQGHIKHVCKIWGSNSRKRNGHRLLIIFFLLEPAGICILTSNKFSIGDVCLWTEVYAFYLSIMTRTLSMCYAWLHHLVAMPQTCADIWRASTNRCVKCYAHCIPVTTSLASNSFVEYYSIPAVQYELSTFSMSPTFKPFFYSYILNKLQTCSVIRCRSVTRVYFVFLMDAPCRMPNLRHTK